MPAPTTTYELRQPARGVLYQVVRDHFERFRAQAADLRDGEGLPGFVEQEFRDFLRCGSLGGGFARFRCAACGFDRAPTTRSSSTNRPDRLISDVSTLDVRIWP